MRPQPAEPLTRTGDRAVWSRVQEVVGPLVDGPGPDGLYLRGADRGPATRTPTGVRYRPVVPARRTVDFGTYLNAFAAAQWRDHVGTRVVRLRIRVDAPAVLTVRWVEDGEVVTGPGRLLAASAAEAVDVPVDAGGPVWFELQAGPQPVTLLDAGWEVGEPARPGGLTIGTPTVGRVDDVAETLRRIASAPALMAEVDRVVVVDHAPHPVASRLEAAVGAELGGLLRVVRQPNLGGAGGYSRVMHEALGEPGSAAVLLLDDDVLIEPAALLTAFAFARRCAGSPIVGLQMLDAARPAMLEAGPEQVAGGTFWWQSVDPRLPGSDVAAVPVRQLPFLHGSGRADFAGWWGAVVPLDVVRAVGYAMPLFLKWDDAEYALRAREAGFRTVSLHGAAIWHESWRGKDDARTWPAFFHARNRLLAALLHGSPRVRTGVLVASLAVEVKQLLALHAFAVERRQEGVRAVLAGPVVLKGGGVGELARLVSATVDLPRVTLEDASAVPERSGQAAAAGPRGGALAAWTVWHLLRHLVAPVGSRATRLAAGHGTWWVLPRFDHVLTPTADGAGYFRLIRDRRRFRRALVTSVGLHLRLWVAWPALRRRYRAAAPALASPDAWRARFEGRG